MCDFSLLTFYTLNKLIKIWVIPNKNYILKVALSVVQAVNDADLVFNV